MSILIKGMDMPTGCISCDFCNPFVEEPYCRRLMKRVPKVTRLDDCPLVPVPPHGDLIDRDYVKEHLYACETNGRPLHKLELCELLDAINDIPTIIEAEEEE